VPPRDRTALVTGGAGFVGANLVRRLLDEGAQVHAVLRAGTDRWRLADVLDRLVVHTVDLTDAAGVRRAVDRANPDVVFHLARHAGNPVTLDYRAAYTHNVFATLNLLEAVTGRPLRRFVHVGSSLEYDFAQSPLRESIAPAPRTIHGVTKAAASILCQHFAWTKAVPAVVLRLFTVYGPWEGPTRFVPRLMMGALDGGAVQVTRRTDVAHDWIFVGDVVDACLTAEETGGLDGEIVNVATGRQSSNADVVALVEEICGHPLAHAAEPFPERPWDTTHWVADVSKARDRLGWSAAVGLRDGLSRTFAWFRDHAGAYRARCD
jgi:nucleoside-diphosphate-sugar epimerase